LTGIVWTGQVNFTDSSDVGTTGVATLTLTPDIGVTNLPALAQGDSGLPPTLRNITTHQVASGTTPPASTWTLVSAGGAGVASVYDIDIYVNSGAAGTSGSFTIASATDITGTPTNKYTLVYNTSDSKYHISPMLAGDILAITPVTGFTSYSGNASQATLGSITVPAQPFDWRPSVEGFGTATSTANTKIELAAMLNNATTGDQVGYAPGVQSATPPPLTLSRAFGAAIGGGSYGRVSAGSAATIYFVAKQVAVGTTDAWGVTAASCAFSVLVNPVP
jgi:hypothetical protein